MIIIPNPFNPTTNIRFDVLESNYVTLKIYDVLGKEIAILINEYKQNGSYLVEFNSADLPSGIYYVKMQTGNFIDLKKMLILK